MYVVEFYLRVWRGREERGLEKMKEQVKEIDDIERGGLWGFIFLHKTVQIV